MAVQARYVLGPALEFQGVGLNGAAPVPRIAAGGASRPGTWPESGKEGGGAGGYAHGTVSVLLNDGGLLGTPHRLHVIGNGCVRRFIWTELREYFTFRFLSVRNNGSFLQSRRCPASDTNCRARQAKRECTQRTNTLQHVQHNCRAE